VEAVEFQDSLQHLSRMSEDERLKVAQKIIADKIKKEKEERALQERENYLAQQESFRADNPNMLRTPQAVMPPGSNEGSFYFYSPQMVTMGRTAFQQRWGRRKLEDDWRRQNKTRSLLDAWADANEDETENEFPEDEMDGVEDTPENISTGVSSDPYDPQFYLQNIPTSEESIAVSNFIISDGLYNMAVIYKDGLNDVSLALETFDQLDTRFPDHENKLEAYYHIYLIYWKEENTAMADVYKQKIREAFPDSELAIAMSDPNYEYNLKMADALVESLYQDTYQAYLAGDVNTVRTNYTTAQQSYGTSKLMPQFMFLDALSYSQTQDSEQFKVQLRELIDKYPNADVSALASEMMKGFQRGLILSASGDNLLARGGLFNVYFGDENTSEDMDSVLFSPETAVPHKLLIIYPQGSLDDNFLLYTVAGFNFGNFIMTDFDLEQTTMRNIGILQIKEFHNLAEVT